MLSNWHFHVKFLYANFEVFVWKIILIVITTCQSTQNQSRIFHKNSNKNKALSFSFWNVSFTDKKRCNVFFMKNKNIGNNFGFQRKKQILNAVFEQLYVILVPKTFPWLSGNFILRRDTLSSWPRSATCVLLRLHVISSSFDWLLVSCKSSLTG